MRALLLLGVVALVVLVDPRGLPAQADALAGQSLRPYAHVFLAYALAWALVLGWIVSLGRRWSRVEDELGRDGDGE